MEIQLLSYDYVMAFPANSPIDLSEHSNTSAERLHSWLGDGLRLLPSY